MTKSLIAGAMALGLGVCGLAYAAADDAKTEKVTGVLIDQQCGKGQLNKEDPEAAAAKHPKACAMKEACAKSGYMVITGKKSLKLDDEGAKKAKEYLAKEDSKTKVVIEGVKDGDTLKVTSIMAAPDAK
jgi:hypothetical protein